MQGRIRGYWVEWWATWADSPEPQQLSSLLGSHPALDDHQDDEPLELDIPEPRPIPTLHHSGPSSTMTNKMMDQLSETFLNLDGSFQSIPQSLAVSNNLFRKYRASSAPDKWRDISWHDLKLEVFDEWHVYMSEYITGFNVAASFSPEGCVSETTSPQSRRLFPIISTQRHLTPNRLRFRKRKYNRWYSAPNQSSNIQRISQSATGVIRRLVYGYERTCFDR